MSAAHVCSWSDCAQIASVSFVATVTERLQLKDIMQDKANENQEHVFLELSELNGPTDTRSIHLLDTASFSIKSNTIPTGDTAVAAQYETNEKGGATSVPTEEVQNHVPTEFRALFNSQLCLLVPCISHVITLSRLAGLLSSTQTLGSAPWALRDYVPARSLISYDWFLGVPEVICATTSRDVLVGSNDDVATLKDGLDYEAGEVMPDQK
ncbi:uncharacterized protein Z518_03265 [Rhinocladiella mackenziei CBS 650.93]|uniref:Uncharacterized protein n=1 Tax=Rhinocladiella mackenziei CBS 650.93 TaxID=1442369 RepID=A0A0D2IRK3_9EURO|nr:uncharacterized protein Z518_03265 [Rhinocladiella mackenziei CBS 650.93]KIX08609.1 hypothetical protein Z518_03265 [Rhinocladiella mackenziei CBS 650.93]